MGEELLQGHVRYCVDEQFGHSHDEYRMKDNSRTSQGHKSRIGEHFCSNSRVRRSLVVAQRITSDSMAKASDDMSLSSLNALAFKS